MLAYAVFVSVTIKSNALLTFNGENTMWTTTPSIIENERPVDGFALHYVPQTYWRVSHAFWFWGDGNRERHFLSAAIFRNQWRRPFLGMNAIDIVGLILVAIGGMILILDLGKPFRF